MNFEVVSPISGFENIKEVRFEKLDEFFAKIHANDLSREISWSLVNPFILKDYQFEMPIFSQILLDLNEDSKFEIYCMLILNGKIESSKIAFSAPLIFNFSNQKMLQIALNAQDYPQFFVPRSLGDFVCL